MEQAVQVMMGPEGFLLTGLYLYQFRKDYESYC